MLYLLSTSCVLTLASSLRFPLGYATATQFLPTRGSSLSATRTTRTSRHSSPSRRPCGALLSFGEFLSFMYYVSAYSVSDIYVINVINNIRTRFIISFYMICAVIYYSFCCIYVWLDPGTYMIARFMFFYKPGVTAHPYMGIDRAGEPRIPSPCSLKAITQATRSKIGSSRSCWNRGTEYYPIGMKTHIEYLDIFFWKYNSP